jgi:hypothetical protein
MPYPVATDSDVVADWLVHFQCHEFLDALVAARFASSRKNAYLFSVRSPIGVRGCCLVLAAFCHAGGDGGAVRGGAAQHPERCQLRCNGW